jgi:bleomycin hydrolase
MFTVRNVYEEKAERYVRMHGHLNFGQGGALPDAIEMLKIYGTVPMSVYEGLNYGSDINRHGEMEGILTGMLDAVIANKNKKLSPVWKDAMAGVLDAYLGKVPDEFEYEGKSYTPKSFAKEVVGVNADDYIQITSWNHQTFYEPMVIMVPDNWNYGLSYNVQMDDMIDIIDHALKNGYTISWAGDVSEKYFSWKNGVAYVPEKELREMTPEERASMFNGPKPERTITQEMRQIGYDNYTTTDDHGMQIVGISKDQNGKEWYLVKNSWGESNDYKGYLYMSKNFVRLKTMSFLLHKDGVPKNLKSKIGV